MARRRTTATPPPSTPRLTGDPLAILGEHGWDAASGGGWTNTEHGITIRQAGPSSYLLEHAGRTHQLTSATGALCMADLLVQRKTATIATETAAAE